MKYFIIAGEASGDLHASNLIAALKKQDSQADFLCMGGDLMLTQGAKLVKHYREMAFMGFVAVIQNLDKVFANLKAAKQTLLHYKPDVVILIDYPGFNLKIAQFVKENLPHTPVHYYIPPKLWAWKTYRIKSIKKYVNEVYTIFPFETDFYKKYNYKVTYVGNPTMETIINRPNQQQTLAEFTAKNNLPQKPIIALLPGSRKHEIQKCLPKILAAAKKFTDYQLVISGSPGIEPDFYNTMAQNTPVVFKQTYELVQHAQAAVVNSGTATLETALIGTPEVVVYHIFAGRLAACVKDFIFKIKHFSLVNILAQKEVVKEKIAYLFTIENVQSELEQLLYNQPYRTQMLKEFAALKELLGTKKAAEQAAQEINSKISR